MLKNPGASQLKISWDLSKLTADSMDCALDVVRSGDQVISVPLRYQSIWWKNS
jgi:hypothetical protein